MSIFKSIINYNTVRGLLDRGFNHQKELSFIIEELLESTGNYTSEAAQDKSKEMSEDMLKESNPTPETIVDAWGDIIVYAVGGITKLGYDPEKVLAEINKEISSRTGKIIDGKFVKDLDAVTYKADFGDCKLDA